MLHLLQLLSFKPGRKKQINGRHLFPSSDLFTAKLLAGYIEKYPFKVMQKKDIINLNSEKTIFWSIVERALEKIHIVSPHSNGAG